MNVLQKSQNSTKDYDGFDMVIGKSNRFKIITFSDLVDIGIRQCIDSAKSNISKESAIIDIGNSYQRLSRIIRGSFKGYPWITGQINTLVLGTCDPSDNIFITKQQISETFSKMWYTFSDKDITTDLSTLNRALRDIFFTYFFNDCHVVQDFKHQNIKFLYVSGMSSKALLLCLTKHVLPSKSWTVNLLDSPLLKDCNDLVKINYKSLVFPEEDIQILNKLVF